jgi:hypothetical protein
MAVENRHFQTTILAGDDMNGTGYQYHAIAANDGQVAANAEEASGIIINKPKDGEAATVLYMGELKFAAGGALSAGDKITVATSGWFTTAGSGDAVVGECKYAVTSGSNGTGFFVFPNVANMPSGFEYDVTAADAISAGKPYALNDNSLANTGLEASGVAPTAITSGSAGKIVTLGIVTATYANSYGPDQDVMVTTSGYFTAVTSGYVPNGRTLTGATSGSDGTINFWGGGGMLLA